MKMKGGCKCPDHKGQRIVAIIGTTFVVVAAILFGLGLWFSLSGEERFKPGTGVCFGIGGLFVGMGIAFMIRGFRSPSGNCNRPSPQEPGKDQQAVAGYGVYA